MTASRSMRRCCATLFVLLTLPFSAAADGVQVRTLDGRTGGLAEHLVAGKWNLVMVWTTYCGVCRGQYPVISEFHDKHSDGDAVVLGIALDGYAHAQKVAQYRRKQAHSFPSVLGEADDFAGKYERTTGETFTGTPTYLLFDKQGALQGFLDGPVKLATLDGAIAQ